VREWAPEGAQQLHRLVHLPFPSLVLALVLVSASELTCRRLKQWLVFVFMNFEGDESTCHICGLLAW
jgi:hypothetical protein